MVGTAATAGHFKGQHVIERINKLLVELAAFSLAKATTSWTRAIALAQTLMPLSTMPHPEVYTSVLSCHTSMRALQTYEGHAWDVVPLSAGWMSAMAPLVRDTQRAKVLRAQLDTLVPQALPFRNPYF